MTYAQSRAGARQALLGGDIAAQEDRYGCRDRGDEIDSAHDEPVPVAHPSAPPDATAMTDWPGSHGAVPGTIRVTMFSTAMSHAKPMMTANTADRTNWPRAIPSTL